MPSSRWLQDFCRLLGVLLALSLGPWALGQTSAEDFETLAAQAAAARDAGRPDEAIALYQRAVQLRPDWDEGWWYLGSLNYDSDHYAEAIPAFQKLLELQPNAGLVWNLLGLSEFEARDYKNSLVHLQRGLELGFADNPSAVKVAKYHVALLLNLNGRFADATQTLMGEFGQGNLPDQIRVALGLALLHVPLLPNQIDPSRDSLIQAAGQAAALVATQKIEQAVQSFQQLLNIYPDTPFLHYAYGAALTSRGRYAEAERELREELRSTPRSAAVHELLGQVLEKLGKPEASVKERAAAKQLVPAAAEVNSAQARAYARGTVTGDTTAVTLITKEPGGPVGTVGAGFDDLARQAAADQAAGRTEAAIASYQNALQMQPQWDLGWSNLGTLYYTTERCPQAILAFKNSVAINPKRPEAWSLLGLCEFRTQDYKNSLIHLQRAQELGFGGNAEAVKFVKYHMAELLTLNHEFEQAMDLLIPEVGPGASADQIKVAMGLALLRIAVLPDQMDPSKAALVRTAGEAATLLGENRYDQAFPVLQRLLKDYPNTPFIHYAYGTALASISQYADAEAQLREETRISPDSALPHIRMASVALQQRRPEKARPAAERALQLAPESAEAHYVMGRTLLELGKTTEAIEELRAASTLAPNSPEVHFSLARAYAKAKLPDLAEQERATFTRLNALVERQKSMRRSQAYGASHDRDGLRPPAAPAESTPGPE